MLILFPTSCYLWCIYGLFDLFIAPIKCCWEPIKKQCWRQPKKEKDEREEERRVGGGEGVQVPEYPTDGKGDRDPPAWDIKGYKKVAIEAKCVCCLSPVRGGEHTWLSWLVDTNSFFAFKTLSPLNSMKKWVLLNSLKERKRPVKHHYHPMCFSKNFMALHRCVFISKIWNFPLFLLCVADHIKNHLCKEEGISQNKPTTPKLQRKPAGYGVIRT